MGDRVKAIPQDYWNVAKVLRLSQFQTFTKVLIPATLPHMFTGYRLSLGIAWLVMSVDAITGLHDLFRAAMTRLSGYSAPAAGHAW